MFFVEMLGAVCIGAFSGFPGGPVLSFRLRVLLGHDSSADVTVERTDEQPWREKPSATKVTMIGETGQTSLCVLLTETTRPIFRRIASLLRPPKRRKIY
jgi:hypothetical protein